MLHRGTKVTRTIFAWQVDPVDNSVDSLWGRKTSRFVSIGGSPVNVFLAHPRSLARSASTKAKDWPAINMQCRQRAGGHMPRLLRENGPSCLPDGDQSIRVLYPGWAPRARRPAADLASVARRGVRSSTRAITRASPPSRCCAARAAASNNSWSWNRSM